VDDLSSEEYCTASRSVSEPDRPLSRANGDANERERSCVGLTEGDEDEDEDADDEEDTIEEFAVVEPDSGGSGDREERREGDGVPSLDSLSKA
jgi:hypothetical protein